MSEPAGEVRSPAAVTVEDVARAAGVSRQTVSRVLNEHPRVALATRERVRTAMAQLRWSPDPAARALARRSTLETVQPHYDVAAAIAELRAGGYRVVEVLPGAAAEMIAGVVGLEGCRGLIVRVV